jgi:hypothetical protein
MYIVTIAAANSHSVFASDASNASAAPWNRVAIDAGTPSSRSASAMALTASPSEAPSARLKEIVAAGNWPMWLMTSGALRSHMSATLKNATTYPHSAQT